jgi:hypothetical protein
MFFPQQCLYFLPDLHGQGRVLAGVGAVLQFEANSSAGTSTVLQFEAN